MRKKRTTSAPERELAMRWRRARKASMEDGAVVRRVVIGAAFLPGEGAVEEGEDDEEAIGAEEESMGSPEGRDATGSSEEAFSAVVVIEDMTGRGEAGTAMLAWWVIGFGAPRWCWPDTAMG